MFSNIFTHLSIPFCKYLFKKLPHGEYSRIYIKNQYLLIEILNQNATQFY